MARFSLESLSYLVGQLAPSECCASFIECCARPAEAGPRGKRCTTNDRKVAASPAAYIRLGRDPDRIGKNIKGGGPKVWFPSSDGWFPLADLANQLTAVREDMEPGIYRLQYGDEDQQEVGELRSIDLEWEERGESSAPQAAPAPRQDHFEQLFRTNLDKARLEHTGQETHQQQLRKAHRATQRANIAGTAAATATLRAAEDTAKVVQGLVEQIGIVQEASLKHILALAQTIKDAKPTEPGYVLLARELRGAMLDMASKIEAKKLASMFEGAARSITNGGTSQESLGSKPLLLLPGPGIGDAPRSNEEQDARLQAANPEFRKAGL